MLFKLKIMLAKVFITIAVAMYAGVVPYFEINRTHVFNPEWVPHARLHEVWQLATNTALGLLSLWFAWGKNAVRLAAIPGLFVMGGFMFAYITRASYGGSMVLSDGSEKMIFNINLGVFSFGIAITLSLIACAVESTDRHRAPHDA